MPHPRSIVLPHQIKKKIIYWISFTLFFFAPFQQHDLFPILALNKAGSQTKIKSSVFSNSAPSKSLLSSKSSLLGFILNLSLSLCIYLSADYHKKKQKPQFFFHTLQKSQLINPTNSDSLHSHVLKPILTSHTSFLILSCI